MERKIKIVADSSSDVLCIPDIEFASAPLKIITEKKEYIDNAELDVCEMANELKKYSGRSSTSCPNVEDWLTAFGDAEEIFCIAISGTISGSYNTACIAKDTYEEAHPTRRVFVFNSLSTGPEMAFIIDKIHDLVLEGRDFDDICEQIKTHSKKTGLLFMLESMKNLANNGRVSPLVAKMAGLLGIRVIGRASEKGDLEMLDKCRGEKKTLETIVERIKKFGLHEGKVKIGHCCNETLGRTLKDMIRNEFEKVKVELYQCRGLCSFYAELGGLLIGIEKA